MRSRSMPLPTSARTTLGRRSGAPCSDSSATPSASRTTRALADAGDGARHLDRRRAGGADHLDLDRPAAAAAAWPAPPRSPGRRSRRRWMTSRRSQVWLISERMWLESRIVCSPRRPRMVARISTICTGSRPLVGSSRMSSFGLCTSACATPTRCR